MFELISIIGRAVVGGAAGAAKGAAVGTAMGGPLEAIAGTIPCAVSGAVIAVLTGKYGGKR